VGKGALLSLSKDARLARRGRAGTLRFAHPTDLIDFMESLY
jgi:hypothetical protein